MTIKNKFSLGQVVYHKTETEQFRMLVTGIQVCLDGGIIYHCSVGSIRDEFYEKELTGEKVYNIALN